VKSSCCEEAKTQVTAPTKAEQTGSLISLLPSTGTIEMPEKLKKGTVELPPLKK
jgi:hypothetical protein